jgi:hypothetical protein
LKEETPHIQIKLYETVARPIVSYCDMTPESRNSGARETAFAKEWFCKHSY